MEIVLFAGIASNLPGTCGLHFLLPYELDARQHGVAHSFAVWIVEHLNVIEHILACVWRVLENSRPGISFLVASSSMCNYER